MKINKFLYIFSFIIIGIIYKIIFLPIAINGGDYVSPTKGMLQLLTNNSVWCSYSGLGIYCSSFNAHIMPLLLIVQSVSDIIRNNTIIVERIALWIPFLIIGYFSALRLTKKIFPQSFFLLSPIIYLCNTYILLLISGGQIIGIGLAYVATPLVFLALLEEKKDWLNSIIIGLLLSIILVFDLRSEYILLCAIALYVVMSGVYYKNILSTEFLFFIVKVLILPIVILILLHAYWLIPLAVVRENPLQQLGSAYNSIAAVKFFSFADFENTIGLLHPNWPENIFGKVGFMRPEFLLLPLLAYCSLLFVGKRKNMDKKMQTNILYFSLLGLLAAFLAKGTNAPFGLVYIWLFQHVPGFVMFRDPTKWYVLIALSYSVLIPFTMRKVYEWLMKREKFSFLSFQFSNTSKIINLQNFFLLCCICYILFLVRPALFGKLTGTFRPQQKPFAYTRLDTFLRSDTQFSRTLWVSTVQRFGYYSQIHPEIPLQSIFPVTDSTHIAQVLAKQTTLPLLENLSVKYVIVPFDSQGEIFTTHGKYDNTQYLQTINILQSIPWLHEIKGFGNIHVFSISSTKDHFWMLGQGTVSYIMQSPTEYSLSLKNVKKGEKLIFSESYDANWQSTTKTNQIPSQPLDTFLNSFVLTQDGTQYLQVTYPPQKWVSRGLIISSVGFLVLILVTLWMVFFKRVRD